MKLELYIDFDGVILNTIDIINKRLEENEILKRGIREEIQNFFFGQDWEELISISNQINDSIYCIKKIIDSGLYDVRILTHVNTKSEAECKIEYLHKYIKGLEVIPVYYGNRKCDAVKCNNAILVDDSIKNLISWKEENGISVHFSDKCSSNEFIELNRLDILMDMYSDFLKIIESKKIRKREKSACLFK